MICQSCRQHVRLHLVSSRAVAASVAAPTRAYSSQSAAAAATAAVTARHFPTAVTPRRRHHPTAVHQHLLPAALYRRSYSASSEASQTKAPATESSSSETDTDAASPTVRLAKPDFLDEAESHIWDLLAEAFAPAELAVRDISGGCGSMYGIEISSDKFRGANMLKQQRMVNAVLGDLMKGWHGVQLKTRVP